MSGIKIPKARYLFGYFLGSIFATAGLFWLLCPLNAALHAPGEFNSGHQELSCADCHEPAKGTVRQRLQANVGYYLGKRAEPINFMYRPVGNEHCNRCHAKPDDLHPVYRFNEPRFAEVRQKLHPERCTSCHMEHSGVRITQVGIDFCKNCHEDTSLKKDPLTLSHQELIGLGSWKTCLGCHDFHGNHDMKLPTEVGREIPPEKLEHYFSGGLSPYPGAIIHKAEKRCDEP